MHSSVKVGDYVYVIGGLHSTNFGELNYLKSCERINISKNKVGKKWEKDITDMNIARS